MYDYNEIICLVHVIATRMRESLDFVLEVKLNVKGKLGFIRWKALRAFLFITTAAEEFN